VVAAVAAAVLACAAQPGAGSVAYASGGALRVLDLDTCRRRTLVSRGAGWPVRLSPSGRWVAFGNGKMVAAAGGKVLQPLGALASWEWSPTRDELAGVTERGAVVVGAPERVSRLREPAGWGADSLAWDPSGDSFVVGRAKWRGKVPSAQGKQEVVLFGRTHGASVVYRVLRAIDPPLVVGYAPYAHGALPVFQPDLQSSASILMDGAPLVPFNPASGLPLPSIVPATLRLPGFFVPCGQRLVVVAGSDRNTQTNKRVVVADFQPATERWRLTDLGRDRRLAWVSPACSPDGRAVVAAAGPDRPAQSTIMPQRSLWLLGLDGRTRRRLTHAPSGWSDDAPLWTADGKAILFVRQRFGNGSLYLLRLADGKLVGPLARLRGAVVGVGVSGWPADSR
jgi:dipeptidyl aminopeptidase/acylaminoacyl peptidase